MLIITAEKKVQINFKTDPDLLRRAKAIVKTKNLDMNGVFNLFLETIVTTETVPVLSKEELKKEQIFRRLQKEVQAAYVELEAGKYCSDEDLSKRYKL